MLPSKRRFFDLDDAALKSVVSGQDGVSESELLGDLLLEPERRVCTPQLALRVASHMELTYATQLRGMQANYPYSIPSHPTTTPSHPTPPLPR